MGRRLDLHDELVRLAGPSYSIYYQPGTGANIRYPCVIYAKDSGDSLYANNVTWRYTPRFQVTVITRDPDCDLPLEILRHFPMCRMDRTFVSDNLYHNVLVLYY